MLKCYSCHLSKSEINRQSPSFSISSTGLNLKFSFSHTGFYTKIRELSLPWYLLIAGEKIVGFFPKVLAIWKMQKGLVHSDNHNAKISSIFLILIILLLLSPRMTASLQDSYKYSNWSLLCCGLDSSSELPYKLFHFLSTGYNIHWRYPQWKGNPTFPRKCVSEYDTKRQFWESEEYGVFFHCHYT